MAQAGFERARLAHAKQQLDVAWDLACRAAKADPANPATAFLHAQIAFESWRPSVELYERALNLDRDNPDLLRNFVQALAAEGQADRAEAILTGIITRSPDWRDGHAQLATIRLTRGDSDAFRSYADAAEHSPMLALDWFNRRATARDWDGAEAVLASLERRCPDLPQVPKARLLFDCESDRASSDPEIFRSFAGHADPGLALLEIRHALRHGDPARAENIAAAWTVTGHASQFWPYRDLAWRLSGDARHSWLHGDPQFVDITDVQLEPGLAPFVRSLHTLQAPYPEQSVRGGTQTARNLLMHHSPLISRLRGQMEKAIEAWRDDLPASDSTHPLLGRKPLIVRFQGSWSVRLTAQGFHSPHTHPAGWASSALYIAVPGGADAGRFALGAPPAELNLELEPERLIEPLSGRLILFPSTSWHATLPCAGDERLTIAFDVEPAIGAATRPTTPNG
jgi:Putative 2OG-Fe(II) oxygenase/Tetratricopeptide repeat